MKAYSLISLFMFTAVTALSAVDWAPAQTRDGQPDVQGYWGQRNNTTTYSLERGDEDRREHTRITGQRAATGKPIVDPPSGLIPYQPWAKDKYEFLLSVHTGPEKAEDLDPVARGFMEGTPRINLQTGFQILQPPGVRGVSVAAITTARCRSTTARTCRTPSSSGWATRADIGKGGRS